MNRRSSFVGFASACVALSVAFLAQADFSRAKGTSAQISIAVGGPVGMTIDGTSNSLNVSEKNGTVYFSSRLAAVKTGIGLRDKHLRERMNAAEHPNVVLAVPRNKLKLPKDGAAVKGSTTGKVTLNGVTQSTPVKYAARLKDGKYQVQGLFDVDIRKFKLEVPCYLGVCVEPVVKVKAKLTLADK